MRREGVLQLALIIIPLNSFQDSIAQNPHLQSQHSLWKRASGITTGKRRLSKQGSVTSPTHAVQTHNCDPCTCQNEKLQYPVCAAVQSDSLILNIKYLIKLVSEAWTQHTTITAAQTQICCSVLILSEIKRSHPSDNSRSWKLPACLTI